MNLFPIANMLTFNDSKGQSMEGRLGSTKSIAARLGITPRVLLQFLRDDPDFPRPVKNTAHHKWWDFKAIEQYLDNRGKIQTESVDYDLIIRKRLANYGGVQNEICR